MSSRTPPPETPVATGVATGSLGTGTAVDDETTLITVPEAPEAAEQPKAAATLPAAAPVTPATTHIASRVPSRRDPYRPIGIALAAILVALVGVAVLSSGGDSPAQVGPAPAATATPDNAVAGDEDEADDRDDGDGDGGDGDGAKGNCNGRGNDPCDRDEGGGD